MNRQRLYRCRHDRRIAGVASGMAEFFDLDPTLVRILWLVSIFFGGFGLLLYFVMAIIVPLEPELDQVPVDPADPAAGPIDPAAGPIDPAAGPLYHAGATVRHRHAASGGTGLGAPFVGMVLILFGGLALVDDVLPGLARGAFLWPAFIVGLGALLIVTSMRRRPSDA